MAGESFTPGPLAVADGQQDDPHSTYPRWDVHVPHKGTTAYVRSYADAVLYAAAPDMFEALDDLSAFIKAHVPLLADNPLTEAARAALANARGSHA